MTDGESIRDAVSAAETELGAIAILVNNAGVAVAKPAREHDESDWDRVVDTNRKGAWLMAQEVARHMVRLGHGGSIVNIASVLGLRVAKLLAPYSAAKAGLIQLTRTLALELAEHDIRVNAIAPGYFETEMSRILPEYSFEEITPEHKLFSVLYSVEEVPQIPSYQSWSRSGGATSEFGAETAVPHIRGIFDDDERLLVLVRFNTDIADGWEREGDVPYFFFTFSPPAYGLGINILLWAMSH